MESQSVFILKKEFDRKIAVLSDGIVPYSLDCFAPDINRQVLIDSNASQDRDILLTHNILLIQSVNKNILIDAGNGFYNNPNGGGLIRALRKINLHKEDITDIVLTHAHIDHIGGLFRKGKLAFNNAKIYLSKIEYDFWNASNSDFSKSKSKITNLLALKTEIVQLLQRMHGRLRFYKEGDNLFGCLRPILASGHTPGHHIFQYESGCVRFIHMADICHEAQFSFTHPDWGTIFDIDFELAQKTRRSLFEQVSSSNELVFGYHMPWPGFGRIEEVEGGYKWSITEYMNLL